MKKFFIATAALCMGLSGPAIAGKGTTEVGADASQWFSDLPSLPDYFPIGGAGQLNGNFVIVERDGIEIGLRATDRKDGLLPPATGKKKGVYIACTGEDLGGSETGRAEWNYDWHVDLRGTDTTLSDYDLTLTQTFAPSLFGETGPLDLTFPETFPGLLDGATLYQSSQNPTFGNDTFDQFAEGNYNLKLTLKPKGKGAPLIAHIRVIVVH